MLSVLPDLTCRRNYKISIFINRLVEIQENRILLSEHIIQCEAERMFEVIGFLIQLNSS
jgi:hypothetical protein